MTTMRVTADVGRLIARIAQQRVAATAGSAELKKAMETIGLVVSSQAKINVRRLGLIDTGNLINSLRYETFDQGQAVGVSIGSFGVPYAAVHEFGFRGVVVVRAHSRRTRSGGSSQVRGHQRQAYTPARPYLGPAVKAKREFILETIRRALGVAK